MARSQAMYPRENRVDTHRSWLRIQAARSTGGSERSPGMALVLEASSLLSDGLAESLGAAGLDLIRTNSVQRAGAIAGSVILDGLVITLADGAGEDDSVRPAINILVQLSVDGSPPVAIVVRGALTQAERGCALQANAFIIEAGAAGEGSTRDRLIRHFARTKK